MKSILKVALVMAVAPLSTLAYNPITLGQLENIYPEGNRNTLATQLPYMNQAMEQYNIDTPERQSAFLGQVGEETGQLNDMTETGNMDGSTYQGRGALQLTGYTNYKNAGNALGENFVNNPSLVSQPQNAWKTAGWYWSQDNLNKDADQNNQAGFDKITKDVNGCVTCSVTHNDVRTADWQRAEKVLDNAEEHSFYAFRDLFN